MQYRFTAMVFLLFCNLVAVTTFTVFASQEADFEYTLGVQAIDLQDYAKAVRHFQTVVQLKPDFFDGRYYLAYSLAKVGKGEEALAKLEELLREKPEDHRLLLESAITALDIDQPHRALTPLQHAIQKYSDDWVFHYYLGLAYFKMNQYDKSVATLEQVARHDKELMPAAWYFAGAALAKQGQTGFAIEKLENVKVAALGSIYAQKADELIQALEGGGQVASKIMVSTTLGVQYDSNVILEPDALEISDESDWRGVAILGLRLPVRQFNFSYSFYQSLHIDLRSFNVQSHSLGADWQRPVDYYGVPLKVGVRTKGSVTFLSSDLNFFSHNQTLEPYLIAKWNKYYQASLTLLLQYEDFRRSDEIRDNFGYGLAMSHLLSPFGPGMLFGVKGRTQFEDADAEFDLFRFKGDLVLALVKGRLHLDLLASYAKEYYARSSTNRDDNRLTGNANIGYRLKKSRFNAGYIYIFNNSNVAAFEYKRHIYSLNWSLNF